MENLLERLEQWLRLNRPDYFSRLQTGLTLEEIAEITAPLGFQLSDEVIKLYQWHNGSELSGDDLFPAFRFLPLREAVEDTLAMRQGAAEYPLGTPDESGEVYSTGWNTGFPNHYDWQDNWFSVFHEKKSTIATIASNDLTTHGSVITHDGEDSWTNLRFNSLKGFISAILECYEIGIYGSERYCLGDPKEVWAKYRDLV